MKKVLIALVGLLTLTLAACSQTSTSATTLVTYDGSKNITVYTRDTTSGTRTGFMEGIGFAEAATSDSVLVTGFLIKDNTAILNALSIDEYGVGYVSLSSVNSTVKGLHFNGVAPTEANVINDTYGLKRPFMWMIRPAGDYPSTTVEQIVQAFIAFLATSDGGDIINNAGAIPLPSTQTWDQVKGNHAVCNQNNSGVVLRIGGSDSIQKVAEALTKAFTPKCGNFSAEHDHTGSSDAYKRTNDPAIKDTSVGKDIGFSSRFFRGAELTVAASIRGQLAWDAIVAIVHLNNPVSNVTADDLKNMYNGTYRTWNALINR
ncbi:MAG: substrate-binding domain-containing protein [Candidatus Izemoplasmatales bacterium]|jgi:phosphate transport system substrate-binding protein|nr:substrate-binding domain-containing protein [bacterium]MDZ4196590.1 substrate-binding domain-containing protein [Candidatus Izemoplasmatales bacterium]